MAKSTVNLDKRIAERDFYVAANIRVSTPAGEGVFHGTTYARGQEPVVLARVRVGRGVSFFPLSDITIIPPGGIS